MRTIYLGLFLLLLLEPFGCAQTQSKRIVTNDRGERVALGNWTGEELLKEFPQFKKNYQSYEPDSTVLAQLNVLDQDVRIVTVLGTWCSDSRREVPRFLKIMHILGNPHFQLEFLCVNRSKRDKKGVAEKLEVELVPTIILFKGDEELGRIVESPQISLEEDLLEILEPLLLKGK